MTLEDDLRATLARAATHAPPAPPGLLDGVARRRRRRARSRLLASAAAVVLVATGTVLAVRHEQPEPVVVTPPPPAITEEQVAGSPPVEEVWPGAVQIAPASLENGKRLRPLLIADDHTTLLTTWSSHERAGAVYAYDQRTRELRQVTLVPSRKGEIADGFVVAGDRLVWHVKTDTSATLWRAPLAGGTAERLPGTLPHVPWATDLVGDRLVYSAGDTGVFSVPVTGGPPTPVPGGEGLHLLEWPWAGDPHLPADGEKDVRFRRLVNLETGEVRHAALTPGDRHVVCGVTTCSGQHADGTSFARARDGSGEREVPFAPQGLAADRFMAVTVTGRDEAEQYVVDVVTGRSGSLELNVTLDGGERSYTTMGLTADDRDMLSAHRTGDDTLVFIDLRRITSGP
ncbi:hypothetical protein [Herbidospora sp. NBRC 101105]|uniref:hypothetical protein n=1 Tax=Herbidospora sp. NBRC 101105 TaxID=3032195 RepID=UPI002555B954|nr:hypothetical protein [Herbidospora sp. NBRC 101105]